MRQSSDEDHGGGEIEEGERGGWCRLVVSGEPTAAGEPTERVLDHPAARLHGEALLILLRPDDPHRDGSGSADALALDVWSRCVVVRWTTHSGRSYGPSSPRQRHDD